MFIGLVILLTFHEFGHAWMALKCGDDTAKLQGRVSLNPLVHIDPIGTVVIPIAAILIGGLLIGWARPVPVNPYNLRNQKLDDILVTLAGPWMNVILAVVLIGLMRFGQVINIPALEEIGARWALLSLFLCFFNMLPIPPLDGSQVVRAVCNISYEAYYQFARWGFLILIVVIQIPLVQSALQSLTRGSFLAIARLFRVALS